MPGCRFRTSLGAIKVSEGGFSVFGWIQVNHWGTLGHDVRFAGQRVPCLRRHGGAIGHRRIAAPDQALSTGSEWQPAVKRATSIPCPVAGPR
jgi:hypothetical protein